MKSFLKPVKMNRVIVMRIVGIEIQLFIYETYSLKEKRSVLRSILDKVRHKFYVAGAEVGNFDQLNTTCIGFAAVSNEKKQAEKVLQKVIQLIDGRFDCEILTIDWIFN